MEQKDQAPPDKSEIWYLALKRLHIAQGPGVKPSTLRIAPGQRFALDGDEPLDVESLLPVSYTHLTLPTNREV